MLEALEAYTLAPFTRILGWSTEQLQVFLAQVRRELVDRRNHIYAKFHYVYGQKSE